MPSGVLFQVSHFINLGSKLKSLLRKLALPLDKEPKMSVTRTVFAFGNIYNKESTESEKTSYLVENSSTSKMIVGFRELDGFTFTLTGDFGIEFDAGISINAMLAGGLRDDALVYTSVLAKNGVIFQQDVLTGITLAQVLDEGNTLQAQQNYFSGNDIFIALDNSESEENDQVWGYGGNDTFSNASFDGLYAERFYGGDGVDTLVLMSARTEFDLKAVNTVWNEDTKANDLKGFEILNSTTEEKLMELNEVERVQFTDTNIALDTDGATSAGGIYRLYKAAFDREPDTGGLGYWIGRADAGVKSAVEIAVDFTWSTEFQNLYGITTTDNYGTGSDVKDLVTGFYENVLDRSPDAGGLDYYTGVIESNEKTVGRVLAEISDSKENYDNTITDIQNGIPYDLWLS